MCKRVGVHVWVARPLTWEPFGSIEFDMRFVCLCVGCSASIVSVVCLCNLCLGVCSAACVKRCTAGVPPNAPPLIPARGAVGQLHAEAGGILQVRR